MKKPPFVKIITECYNSSESESQRIAFTQLYYLCFCDISQFYSLSDKEKQEQLRIHKFGTIFSFTNPNAQNTIEHFYSICVEVKEFMEFFYKQNVDHKRILFECIHYMTESGGKPYKTGVIDVMECIESRMVVTEKPIDYDFYKILNRYDKDILVTSLKSIFDKEKSLLTKYTKGKMKFGVILMDILKLDVKEYNILIYEFLLSVIFKLCINTELFLNTCKLFFGEFTEKINKYIQPKLAHYTDPFSFEECPLEKTIKFDCKKTHTTYCLCSYPPEKYVIEECQK